MMLTNYIKNRLYRNVWSVFGYRELFKIPSFKMYLKWEKMDGICNFEYEIEEKRKIFPKRKLWLCIFKIEVIKYIYENCINFSLEEGRQMKKNVVKL